MIKKVIIWILNFYNILLYFSPLLLPKAKYTAIIIAVYLGVIACVFTIEYSLYKRKRGTASKMDYLHNRTSFLSENFSYIIISVISAIVLTILFFVLKNS